MRLVRWSFHNIHIPMMEDEKGELFCTSVALRSALGLEDKALQSIFQRHREEFDALRPADCGAKDFLSANKAEFGIQRVRGDLILWSEDDMLTVAFHSRSPASLEFRRHLRQFIKANARKNYITKEEHDAMLNELRREIYDLREDIGLAQPALSKIASDAGTNLNRQKYTKGLRLVK